MIELNDTIAALSTSPGASGIAVVKISGPDALAVLKKVFKPKSKKENWTPRRMILGHVADSEDGIVDEALACYMPAPGSYTMQDVVEIQTHGGGAASATLLDLLADAGVRMAGPGEFTQRAFLLGRIDLAQAEAILDIVHAQTQAGLIAAQRQLSGSLSQTVKEMRARLIDGKALLEANIDFPEEGIGDLDQPRLTAILEEVTNKLNKLLSTYTTGRLFRQGALCVIAGRPNVGKSSLLNYLLEKRRAIVTSTPGTTRDAIEATANIEGVPFRLVDTAGIRKSDDAIEDEGVRITHEQIEKADLVLLMTDASTGVTEAGRKIQKEMTGKNVLHLVNKTDLVNDATAARVGDDFGKGAIPISAKTGKGIDGLRKAMIEAVGGGKTLPSDEAVLTNARHRQALLKGRERIDAAKKLLLKDTSPELIALDIDDAFNSLGEIVGETTPDDVLNHIFEQFCIGK